MKPLMDCLAIGLAGFLGAVSRWLVASGCGRLFGPRFPVGTLLINLSGSFFLGWFATMASTRLIVRDRLRIAVAVGFVGAYTTFSTWMFESNALWNDGAFLKASANVVGSVILGLIAVRLGVYLAAK